MEESAGLRRVLNQELVEVRQWTMGKLDLQTRIAPSNDCSQGTGISRRAGSGRQEERFANFRSVCKNAVAARSADCDSERARAEKGVKCSWGSLRGRSRNAAGEA
eukprot:GFKZ01010886.1.p2 GENE.GFKZ01010886.1~~GFKZ01010886.1.p2  ORF type:complete len:105 (-),score=7.34 GFKZ01010886.1:511-825(-)